MQRKRKKYMEACYKARQTHQQCQLTCQMPTHTYTHRLIEQRVSGRVKDDDEEEERETAGVDERTKDTVLARA